MLSIKGYRPISSILQAKFSPQSCVAERALGQCALTTHIQCPLILMGESRTLDLLYGLSEGFFLLCQSRVCQRFPSWILYISLKPAQIKPAPCDLCWHWLSRVALTAIYIWHNVARTRRAGSSARGSAPLEARRTPKDGQQCPRPPVSAGASASHTCCSACAPPAHKVIKWDALLSDKGVI